MEIKTLFTIMPQTGTLHWIGIRPEKRTLLKEVEMVEVTLEEGILGDHYSGRSGKRQITLIQKEHLEVVEKILGQLVSPQYTRRNLVTAGINLQALIGQKFSVGEVILEGTGHCHPCSRMEQNLGPGGYNAMRGHGGLTARVVKAGFISKNDQVKLLSETDLNP